MDSLERVMNSVMTLGMFFVANDFFLRMKEYAVRAEKDKLAGIVGHKPEPEIITIYRVFEEEKKRQDKACQLEEDRKKIWRFFFGEGAEDNQTS